MSSLVFRVMSSELDYRTNAFTQMSLKTVEKLRDF